MNTLFIGDNRDALKLIPENSVKLVYMDPPYNTLSEKSYNDRKKADEWSGEMLDVLRLSAQCLKDDGVLFASIDDNEYANMKILCDSVFGRKNFIGTFITMQAQRSNSRLINTVHEYVLVYAKNINQIKRFSIRRVDIPEQRAMIEDIVSHVNSYCLFGVEAMETALAEKINIYGREHQWLKNYRHVDSNGEIYFASDLSMPGKPCGLDVDEINLHLPPLKSRSWASPKHFMKLYKSNRLVWIKNRPYEKKYLKEARDNAPSLLNFYSRQGTRDLEKLGMKNIFDTPKPVELIKFLIRLANLKQEDIVLDPFAGSGTTGQAVMEVNFEDKISINFILIQKKEKLKEKSEFYTICVKKDIEPEISAITRERLARVQKNLGVNYHIDKIDLEDETCPKFFPAM